MPAPSRFWPLAVLPLCLPHSADAQAGAARRFQLGAGAVLLAPDRRAGLTLWAARETRPGRRPSPDFVGWFEPASVAPWVERTRPLLTGAPIPPTGEGLEAPTLTALDGGRVSLVLLGDGTDRPFYLSFGHPSERQRWVIEATAGEVSGLLDSMRSLAARSRLDPPEGIGYANPTHRATTPDREPGARLPDVGRVRPGEVWASAELDATGAVLPGTSRVLWSSRPALAAPVLAVLPGYRYRRRDGGRPERLVIYQRFRVRGGDQ